MDSQKQLSEMKIIWNDPEFIRLEKCYDTCTHCGKDCNVSDMNGTVCQQCFTEIMEAQI